MGHSQPLLGKTTMREDEGLRASALGLWLLTLPFKLVACAQ